MIDLSGNISLSYLKKSAYTGSFKGMRFRLCRKDTEEGETFLAACIWAEPFCFEATPDEKKTEQDFPFGKDGLVSAVAWLNQAWLDKIYAR